MTRLHLGGVAHAILDHANPYHPRGGYVRPHIVLITLAIFLAGVLAGVFGTKGYEHLARGGAVLGGSMPPTAVYTGPAPPVSRSLARYIVRIHNQGSNNSCVAQAASTIEELESAERGRGQWFSPGYIYNQGKLYGGDNGMTYATAFSILTTQGDSSYSTFPYDGTGDIWTQPGYAARVDAAHYRLQQWYTIAVWDRTTIEAAIAHGYPIAIGFAWRDSLINQWNTQPGTVVYMQWGNVQFSHVTTGVGYNQYGLTILNSWGPSYGYQGTITLSWQFLIDNGAQIIGSLPANSITVARHRFPKKIWNQRRAEKHQHLIPYKDRNGRISHGAELWWKHRPALTGGVVRHEHWYPRGPHGRDGFENDSFQGYDLFWWPHHPHWHPVWHRHRWIR